MKPAAQNSRAGRRALNSLPPPTGDVPHGSELPPPPQAISSVAFTERHGSSAPSLEPQPSRRRGWLVLWIFLALLGLAAVIFALTRNDDSSVPDSPGTPVTTEVPDTVDEPDPEPSDVVEPEPVFEDSPDTDTDTDIEPGLDTDTGLEPDTDPADDAPDPANDLPFGDDFEPVTSVNPSVTLADDG